MSILYNSGIVNNTTRKEMTMNSFDSVCVEEIVGYNDYMEMQLMMAQQEIEHLEEFNRWIDTNRPTSEELDRWFDESCEGDDDHDDDYDDDGQPSEYEEWQDYMGGDDWDHGQYDCDY